MQFTKWKKNYKNYCLIYLQLASEKKIIDNHFKI